MEHKHSVYDTDTHFVIVKDTREIRMESKPAPVIVQHDHNSERFSFVLDRWIDGHDMTLCNEVQVHYLNIDSATKETAKGVYSVDDIRVLDDENTVVCSWLISENATQYAGKLNFMIRFACIAADGTVLYRWNTGIYTDLSVASGYDNGEAVTADFTDILAQWKADLFGIGDTEEQRLLDVSAEQQAAIAAEGQKQIDAISGKGAAVLDSIPDEYEALSAMVDNNHRNKAGAIVLDAEGESIVVNDASEYPLMGLKVFGKSEQLKTNGYQLFNACGEQNNAFGTAEVSDNGRVITVTGTYYVSFTIALTAGETYYVNFKHSTNGGNYGIRFEYADNSISETLTNPFEFVPAKDVISIYLYSSTGEEKTVVYEDVQICKGNTALPWEEYSGGVASPSPEYPQDIVNIGDDGSVAVTVYGTNLLDYETWKQAGATYATATFADNGVILTTAEDRGDGFTNYTNKFSKVPCVPGVKYILTWEHSGANGMVYIFPNGNVDNMISVWTNEASQLEYIPPDGVEYFTFRVGVSAPGVTAT